MIEKVDSMPETLGGKRTILVDIRVCQVNRERGIPVYVQSLLLELPKLLPEAVFILWHDPKLPPPTRMEALTKLFGQPLSAKELGALPPTITITDVLSTCIFVEPNTTLEQHLLPTWLKAHHPRRLAIIYDLIPYRFPKRYLTNAKSLNAYVQGVRCLRAYDEIFTISESARRDAIQFAAIDPSRVHNIYGGLDPSKAAAIASGGETWDKVKLPSSYAIYVGGNDWRKNMEGAIQAFARYQSMGGRVKGLVLACATSEHYRQSYLECAAKAGLSQDQLILTGHISDAELVSLMRGAELSLFPSFYEGLGLPIIESYACGTPVLASNTSSLPELVPPACQFDPWDVDSIASLMLEFDKDPSIRAESLAFGKRILDQFRWDMSANRLVKAAFKSQQKEAPTSESVAMIGVLPPARSGIARINAEYMTLPHRPVHYFAAFERAVTASAQQPRAWSLLAHPRSLGFMQTQVGYQQRLFVFGNSSHHQATLDALRATRTSPGQTWLYLHDGDLLGLWTSDLAGDLDAVHAFYRREYPEWLGAPADLLSTGRPKGIRPLLRFGKHVGIIVNSRAAERMVQHDVGEAPPLGLHVLHLPVEPHLPTPPPPPMSQLEAFRIGTFGKPEKAKQLEKIISAAEVLNRTHPCRLIVAGYDAHRFLKNEGLHKSKILEVLDSPSDAALIDAMSSVHVAVQLRYPSHGESSGVVGHLFGLGIPMVATRSGSFAEMEEVMHLVEPGVPAAELATAILDAFQNASMKENAAAYRARHLPEAFQSNLESILTRHLHQSTC